MILILGEDKDYSTLLIEQWLLYYGEEVFKITENDFIESIFFVIDNNNFNIEFNIKDKKISLKEVSKIFIRRYFLRYLYENPNIYVNKKKINIKKYLHEEFEEFSSFFNHILRKKAIVYGNNKNVNKLLVLYYAKTIGLNIPQTIITDEKENLLNFNKNLITKAIKDSIYLKNKNQVYYNLTSLFNIKDIKASSFFPSLLQEKLKTLIEIRVFLFNNSFFSMAIFFKNNDEDIVDYRDYNNSENAYVPYRLPKIIEKKLLKLSKIFDLNTCSFDLILNESLEYYLLEINTEGQFNWVSYECNYYIEEIIAQTIIKNEKKKE